jgi:hypothetical protein
MTLSKVLRYVAFTLMALFGLLGTLFVAGYAFEDPGGWAAVAMTVAWVVPMVALAVFALRRPEAAEPVLVGVTVAVGLFAVLDETLDIIPRDDWGPVTAIVVFGAGVVLAFLGLHRAKIAGVLMTGLALTQLLAIMAGVAIHETGDGPGPGAMLGGSSGVVVLPLLVIGGLFLLAGSMDHEEVHLHWPTSTHPAH